MAFSPTEDAFLRTPRGPGEPTWLSVRMEGLLMDMAGEPDRVLSREEEMQSLVDAAQKGPSPMEDASFRACFDLGDPATRSGVEGWLWIDRAGELECVAGALGTAALGYDGALVDAALTAPSPMDDILLNACLVLGDSPRGGLVDRGGGGLGRLLAVARELEEPVPAARMGLSLTEDAFSRTPLGLRHPTRGGVEDGGVGLGRLLEVARETENRGPAACMGLSLTEAAFRRTPLGWRDPTRAGLEDGGVGSDRLPGEGGKEPDGLLERAGDVLGRPGGVEGPLASPLGDGDDRLAGAAGDDEEDGVRLSETIWQAVICGEPGRFSLAECRRCSRCLAVSPGDESLGLLRAVPSVAGEGTSRMTLHACKLGLGSGLGLGLRSGLLGGEGTSRRRLWNAGARSARKSLGRCAAPADSFLYCPSITGCASGEGELRKDEAVWVTSRHSAGSV